MSIAKYNNLITATQAAKLCGFSRQRWNQLFTEDRIPEPKVTKSRMNLWDKQDVLKWNTTRENYNASKRGIDET